MKKVTKARVDIMELLGDMDLLENGVVKGQKDPKERKDILEKSNSAHHAHHIQQLKERKVTRDIMEIPVLLATEAHKDLLETMQSALLVVQVLKVNLVHLDLMERGDMLDHPGTLVHRDSMEPYNMPYEYNKSLIILETLHHNFTNAVMVNKLNLILKGDWQSTV